MRVEIDDHGCWNWTGHVNRDTGYGVVAHPVLGTEPAHRASYRLFYGRLTKGMQIDHLCRNRRCVNPLHLELVSPQVNQHRGEGPTGKNHRKTHCVHGHPFDAKNTYVTPRGDRQCRTCRAAAEREGRKRRLARAREARARDEH